MKHVPNALSLGRIVIAPVFLVLFVSGTFTAQLIALVLFVIGAISDWLDGEVARRYDVGSRLGQFLDPLADKVLVLGAFFALFFLPADDLGRTVQQAWWWIPVLAIAGRDVAVTWLRSWAERRGTPVRTSSSAKAKTGLQLTFLIALQVFLVASRLDRFGGWLADVASVAQAVTYSLAPDLLLVITAIATVWTGALYFMGASTEPETTSEPLSSRSD